MSIFRRLSTRRLLALLGGVAALAVGAGVLAVTAIGGSGAPPAPEPLAQAVHDALVAPTPDGITARVTFTNNLVPNTSFLGNATSALLGASGRLWLTNDGRGRIELQSDAGDTDIMWSGNDVTVYDSSSDTAYELTLPAHDAANGGQTSPPTVDQIAAALAKLGSYTNISDALPDVVAGEPAYSVSVSPKSNGGLFGDLQLSWDATNGTPLRVAVTAQGDPTPMLALEVTNISYGAVSDSDVTLPIPSSAKVVDLGTPTAPGAGSGQQPVTGIAAVRAAAGFAVVAPDSVGGRPLTSARLVGHGAMLTYGDGLGALVVHERAADGGAAAPSFLDALPRVSLGSVDAHELQTPLGTVLAFDHGGLSFVVGGSMTGADAEAAAKAFA